MKTVLFILIFLIVGSLLIIENNNLAMYKPENQKVFSEKVGVWFNQLYGNFQSMTGLAVKMNWFYR